MRDRSVSMEDGGDPRVRSQCDRCNLSVIGAISAIGVILGCDLSANLAGAWWAWLGWVAGAWRRTVYGVEVRAWARVK